MLRVSPGFAASLRRVTLERSLRRVAGRLSLASTTIDPIRGREVRWMLRRLDLGPEDAVLDVGCAFGVWTHHVGRRVRRAAGVDPDASAVEHGRRSYPGIDLRVADGRALPFADGEFDKVVFISTLEHIERPEAVLAEIARVLRPGGRLAISVDTLNHRAWRQYREIHARRSYVSQYFTRDELLAMAGRHGLVAGAERHIYGNALAPALLRWRLKPTNLHWLLAPVAWGLSAVLDDRDSGMMYETVMRREGREKPSRAGHHMATGAA